MPFTDTLDKPTPLERLWGLLRPDVREVRNIYIFAVFSGLVNLSLPLGIQGIINLIQGGQVSTAWMVLVFFVVLGVALMGVIRVFQMRITENLQQKVFARAAFEFTYRIPRVRMELLYRHYAPELMNRFFDVLTVQKGLSKLLLDFSSASLMVFFGLVLLSLYHPFFIVFSLILLLLIGTIFKLTAARGLSTSLMESKHKYRVAHWLEELARTSVTFRLAGRTDLPLHRVDGHVSDYLTYREAHFRVLVQQYSLMVVFKVLVAMGLLAIGGYLVIEQQMNIGQFIAAEIIILLVMAAVEKLIVSLESIYDVLTALEKIGQVTDLDLEQDSGIDLCDHCQGDGLKVDLRDVTFSYPDFTKPTLDNLSLSLMPGEKVVVVGSTGSGKTTLLQILAGLYDVQQGTVAYNDLPRGNLELGSLRSIIGDCLSEELLFEGTILDNITMGRKAATFERVQWAVRELGIDEYIRSQPKGYETVLDTQGRRLPRGIVQKLLLARSIVDEPRLLLLEDVLDVVSEDRQRTLSDFLMAKERGWTLVAITTDAYMAQLADRVILMEDGRIVRQGTYSEMSDIFN
jgi:ABC-type bacteriocin/lantibiotic exporter with double-glycine peptidase domain